MIMTLMLLEYQHVLQARVHDLLFSAGTAHCKRAAPFVVELTSLWGYEAAITGAKRPTLIT